MALYLPKCGPLLAAAFLSLLSACGGQDSDPTVSNKASTLLPTVFTSEGRALNSCSFDPACSGNPLAPFFAGVTMAPDDGATVGGVVRLEVSGNDLGNVELLPSSGYSPKLGVFNRSGDRTRAWMDFDTRTLPNGPVGVRISAFNVPAGQPGAEIVAMSARTWNINNSTQPPSPFTAGLVSAPAPGAAVSGIVHLEVQGSGMVNVELLPANGSTPKLGVFNVSGDRTSASLDLDSRSLPDGPVDVRISAFNVTEGQPGAQEIIVMPARQWDIRNGAGFTARVAMAPPSSSTISGVARLEVRGTGMRNVELLPASGYTPRLGVFNVSADGTFAWLDFETAKWNGLSLDARISAFNVAAGQPGATEIIAMPRRFWNVRNAAPGSTSSFSATLVVSPPDGQVTCVRMTIAVNGTGMKNVELLPVSGYAPLYGRFDIRENGTTALFELDPQAFTPGDLHARISVFDAPPGQPAKELIVLSERKWRITHLSCKFGQLTEENLRREVPDPSVLSMPIQN
jgi:hypothetical protein